MGNHLGAVYLGGNCWVVIVWGQLSLKGIVEWVIVLGYFSEGVLSGGKFFYNIEHFNQLLTPTSRIY